MGICNLRGLLERPEILEFYITVVTKVTVS